MEKNLSVFGVVLFLGVLTFPGTARGGDLYHFSGLNADAYFDAVTDCTETGAYVFANNGKFQSPPGPGTSGSSAYANLYWYNICGTEEYFYAWSQYPIGDVNFQISRNLASAQLNASFHFYGYNQNGEPIEFDAQVDLNWTPAGPASRSSNRYHFQNPWFIENRHDSSVWRPAEASGTISDGTTNFTPEVSLGASLSYTRGGVLYIERKQH